MKDISSLARIIGIPHFLTVESLEEEKEDAATLRRLKKRKALQEDEGDENNLAPPAEVPPAASDVGQQLRVEQVRAVQRMQRQFQGRIIRRTTASKDYLGNSIVNLPPYRIIEGQIKLTDREMAVISELAEKAKDS